MPLYFISAASGTGKTTLMHELLRRGLNAHDTDVECIRRSKLTGEVSSYHFTEHRLRKPPVSAEAFGVGSR